MKSVLKTQLRFMIKTKSHLEILDYTVYVWTMFSVNILSSNT